MGLHETAILARRLIFFGIAGFITLIILITFFNSFKEWWQQRYPPPGPPPTAGFGKLPPLQLPTLFFEGTPSFLLETPTGELPVFTADRLEVVAIKEVSPTLLREQRARSLARALDFGGEGKLSADKNFIVFKDTTDKRTLTVDLTTQNFTLTTDVDYIEKIVRKGSALTGAEAVKRAQYFLAKNGLLKEGFEEGTQTTQLHLFKNGKIENAPSVSEGQFTRIDFFRNLTDVSGNSFAILPSNPKIGLIQIWLTSGLEPDINNILYVSYTVWGIDRKKVETYPLRPVSEAWEEVQKGEGAAGILIEGRSPLDSYTPLALSSVTIRNITLAYFDDASFQKYLQPIYVFSGGAKTTDGRKVDYTAYRPAIPSEWIQQ